MGTRLKAVQSINEPADGLFQLGEFSGGRADIVASAHLLQLEREADAQARSEDASRTLQVMCALFQVARAPALDALPNRRELARVIFQKNPDEILEQFRIARYQRDRFAFAEDFTRISRERILWAISKTTF